MNVIKPEYQTPLIGAYLILIKGGKILLSRRNDSQYKGVYSLVCGHVEKGEDVISAIVREAKEEANMTLEPASMQVVAVIHRPNADYKGKIIDIIDFFIFADDFDGEITNMEPEKTQELEFCDLNRLPENCTKQVKEALILFKEKKFYEKI